MGIVPLEFPQGESAATLGLTGFESYTITGLASGVASAFSEGRHVEVKASRPDGAATSFRARVRLDTPQEIEYYRHGGILQYVLRQLLTK